ncbi:MAG: hypothetical protein OXF88_13955 [Rhodobacteraceae bacterium]|nr:hypothetical protein [Paracoccaceae bacterium]MCY4139735.1 hypothetical protein [Paracoccaceae bacterium]
MAEDLFRGNVHRRLWPDENMREALRAEAAGPFSIAYGIGGGRGARTRDVARIVQDHVDALGEEAVPPVPDHWL